MLHLVDDPSVLNAIPSRQKTTKIGHVRDAAQPTQSPPPNDAELQIRQQDERASTGRQIVTNGKRECSSNALAGHTSAGLRRPSPAAPRSERSPRAARSPRSP